jgi:hypothetical protein
VWIEIALSALIDKKSLRICRNVKVNFLKCPDMQIVEISQKFSLVRRWIEAAGVDKVGEVILFALSPLQQDRRKGVFEKSIQAKGGELFFFILNYLAGIVSRVNNSPLSRACEDFANFHLMVATRVLVVEVEDNSKADVPFENF